jgi:hypothetical protein
LRRGISGLFSESYHGADEEYFFKNQILKQKNNHAYPARLSWIKRNSGFSGIFIVSFPKRKQRYVRKPEKTFVAFFER